MKLFKIFKTESDIVVAQGVEFDNKKIAFQFTTIESTHLYRAAHMDSCMNLVYEKYPGLKTFLKIKYI